MDFSEPAEAAPVREAVRSLCEGFPGEYWRGLEPDRYPEEFVTGLHRRLAAELDPGGLGQRDDRRLAGGV